MAMRMREYAVHADYAHIREYADADENLIHINHNPSRVRDKGAGLF